MKTKYIFFSLVALCMLSACTKDEEVAITTVQINNLSIAPQYTRSAFACDLVANSPIADVELQYSTDPLFGEGLYQTLQLNQNEHHYTANLEPLQQGQTYYVRYKVFNSFNSMIPARVDTFRTRAYTLPSVRTDSVTHITTHSADCYFTLTDWGCDSLPSVGICRFAIPSGYINFPYTVSLSDSTFVCSLSELTDGRTYSVYAFAKNAQGTAYSEKVIKFTTIAIVVPSITTSDITAISYTSAVCGGDITSDGNAEVTERGICYATTAQPTTKDSVILCGSGTGAFSTVLPNLQDGTTYYVRAFATNSKGTAYGEQKTFATPAYSLPTLTTAEVTNISYTTATCGGNITSDGGQTITARGVCYSTKSNPTIADSKVASDSRTSFSCNLTGLADGTTYYVRAYATNGKGTAYGEQKKFTTTDYSLPIISTADVTNISYTSATCGGNITADGGQTITARGVCYSTKSNPTIADKKVIKGSGMGSFSYNLTGLSAGTTYYVRAYATSGKGTVYGEQKIFTTIAYSLPIISHIGVDNIFYTSAKLEGSITSDGGQTITDRGFCYSTKSNPTIIDNAVAVGNGMGSFTCKLTGLSSGTTYYARAYAINSKGTAYSEQMSWTTEDATQPTVKTMVKTLTLNTAECYGYVFDASSSSFELSVVTEVGICYSTQHLPTIRDNKIICEGYNSDFFSCVLSGLVANETYYVCAYAITAEGVFYGEERELTMSFGNNEYVPKAFSVNSVRKVVFAKGNLQYQASSDTWRFANYQYEHIGDANENISKTYTGWIDLFGWGTGNNPTLTSKDTINYQTFVDWGINRIDGDAPNSWRTLSADEWRYIFETRANANNLCGMACVNNELGLVLLPDDWVQPQDIPFVPGLSSNAYDSFLLNRMAYKLCQNYYSTRQWHEMESEGAVFLPKAGARSSGHVSSSYHVYWTSASSPNSTSYVFFANGVDIISSINRSVGCAVRLVKNVK